MEGLKYVVDHVFFPVRLPQKDDSNIEKDITLCGLVLNQAVAFQACLPLDRAISWDAIIKMLRILRALQSASNVEKDELLVSMGGLEEGGKPSFLFIMDKSF